MTTTAQGDLDLLEEPPTGPADPTPAPLRRFLPLPAPLTPSSRRLHRAVLGLLLLFGLVKGGFWILTTPVWSPVDEVQHFSYVKSLATGQGIPVVGRDLVTDDVIATVKASPTTNFRSESYGTTNQDPYWGGIRYSYEAIHGPTYYALMVPFYWAGHPAGVIGELYAVRIGTLLVALAVIPCTWLLARRLFPDRPVVWLLAAAIITALSSLAAGGVSNDTLAVLLATAVAVAFLRALDRPGTWGPLLTGALFGITMVTKVTSMVLIPWLAIAFVSWVVVVRPGALAALRWAALAGAGAVVAYLPWLAWNLRTYHSPTAAAASSAVTGNSMPTMTFSLDTMRLHADLAWPGVWLNPLSAAHRFGESWAYVFLGSLVLGLVSALWKRRGRDALVVLWCGTALPFAFLMIEGITFLLFGGTGFPVGRHLTPALGPTAVMIAAAAVLLVGARFAPVAIGWILAASLVLEARIAESTIREIYLVAALDTGNGPVVTQDWSNVVHVAPPPVRVESPCPVTAVGLGIAPDQTPPSITVTDGRGDTTAAFRERRANMAVFRIDEPAAGTMTVTLPPGVPLRASVEDRVDRVSFAGLAGDPVIRVYCANTDGDELSFRSLYFEGHPDLGLGVLEATPIVLAGIGVVTATGLTLFTLLRRRRTPSVPAPTPPSLVPSP